MGKEFRSCRMRKQPRFPEILRRTRPSAHLGERRLDFRAEFSQRASIELLNELLPLVSNLRVRNLGLINSFPNSWNILLAFTISAFTLSASSSVSFCWPFTSLPWFVRNRLK